jgi:hypothetical protein
MFTSICECFSWALHLLLFVNQIECSLSQLLIKSLTKNELSETRLNKC